MQNGPQLEFLNFTNLPSKRVVTPTLTTSESHLTVDEHPGRTMEQANKALERSQAAHRKSAQSMEKAQMSKAPRQVSGDV